MSDLPTVVKVGYQRVKLTIQFNRNETLGDSFGCYISELGEIRIKPGQSRDEMVNTVLHEILHAVVHTYSLRELIDEKKEETIVGIFANALTQVLRDNTELLLWIGHEPV